MMGRSAGGWSRLALGAWLLALLPLRGADGIDFYWRMGTSQNDNWFDGVNWSEISVISGNEVDSGNVPRSGDDIVINSSPAYTHFRPAEINPSNQTIIDNFNRVYTHDGRRYLLYECGNIAVSNNHGPLTTSVFNMNMRGSVTVGGIDYWPGMRTGRIVIGPANGGASGGRAQMVNGLLHAESVTVATLRTSMLEQFGGKIYTPFFSVGQNGLYEAGNGELEASQIDVGNFGRFKLKSGTATALETLSAGNNSWMEVMHGTLKVTNASTTQSVFTVNSGGRMDQTGGLVEIAGKSSLHGTIYLAGGIYRSPVTSITKFASIDETAVAHMGALEIGNGSSGVSTLLLDAGKLNASSVVMYHPRRTAGFPDASAQAVVSVGDAAQVVVAGAMNVGASASFTTETLFPCPLPTTVLVNHAGAKFSADSMGVGQTVDATASLIARAGGVISATTEMRLGDLAGATGTAESHDAGSEIGAHRIWLGKVPGSTGRLTVSSGGSLRATDGIVLGPITGNATASMLIGGPNPGGGFLPPGPVNSPFILRGGDTANGYNVTFQHSGSGYAFTPRLQKVDTVFHSGGSTHLNGRVWDVGGIVVSAGGLHFTHTAAVNNAGYMVLGTGGSATVRGATLRTEDVAAPRILIHPAGSSSLSVVEGGTLETGMVIGASASSSAAGTARVFIDGMGSNIALLNQDLPIGSVGPGSLSVLNGAKLTGRNGTQNFATRLGIDAAVPGGLTVSGFGSEFKTAGLTVGQSGLGNVHVSGYGALLASDVAVIGANANSEGTVRVTDNAAWRVGANHIIIGDAGKGLVSLDNSATLRVGSQGNGAVLLSYKAGGEGILELRSNGTPGTLVARSVESGASAKPAIVRFSHRAANYVFTPQLYEVDLELASGNLGNTTLTAAHQFLSSCSITSGGLRFAQGASAYMDSQVVVADGRIIDMDQSELPVLEIDGPGSLVEALSGIVVGKASNGKLVLKNGGKIIVRNSVEVAENSVLLGPDDGSMTGTCSLVFGGGATIAPGLLDAHGIFSRNADGEVIFDHSSSGYVLNSYISGKVRVRNLAGTTLVNAYAGHSGTTTVTGGTLLVSQGTTSIVTLGAGGTFGGKGTVARVNAPSGSTISPGTFLAGQEIGDLRVTYLNLYGGSRIRIDLGPNLTCDRLLNHKHDTVNTTFLPVTSGTVTFDFRNRGINQTGVYPIMTTTSAFTTAFMNRLVYVSDFPLQGSFRQTRITNDPASSTAYSRLEFVVTSLGSTAGYNTWATSFGLDPAGNGLPHEDPDHDGLPNMIEYMLRSSPVSGVPANLPTLSHTATHATFGFVYRPEVEDLFRTEVEYSTDLSQWTTAAPGMIASYHLTGRGMVVTASIPLPAPGTRFFCRLRIRSVVNP